MFGIMEMGRETKMWLDIANTYAKSMSGCRKVAVGCVIVKGGNAISIGANISVPDLCKTRGCMRVEKYGEDAKSHRLPEDCRAVHSEIHAISRLNQSACNATIYVTRYPCEACARAIIAAGISRVVYGRTQPISDETARMLESYGVEVNWCPDWVEEDTTR